MASINLSSFAGAGAQFFDNNGAPLTGGLLYVYTAGTTTPATTYTTSSGTVSNTNPIVLDSAGRTPNEVWVNGGVLYKFVLKTSAGVTIGTYDNIPSIDDPTAFNNIITVTGTNTLIGTSTPPNTAYVRGMTLSFVVVNTNTGAVTIDVDGLGAKEITIGSTALSGNELTAGRIVMIEYDGTRFQVNVGALANNSVTTAKLVDGSVTTAKIADANVTTAKIADANVTAAKLATNAATGNLGFTPVQQGTGIGQLGNTVKIGWSGSNIKATVDTTDQGILYTGNNNPILALGNGYQKLASGLILQWGSFTYSTGGGAATGSITLPTTFPTAATSLQLCISTAGYTAATALSSSSFSYQFGNSAGTCYWFAVGL